MGYDYEKTRKSDEQIFVIRMVDVSVIYVNYRTIQLILDSVKSIKERTLGISYEIIVVDNACDEESFRLIKDRYPEIICIQSVDNLGFGKGNNLGIEQAQGDFVLFLNPDTVLRNNAIDILCRFMKDNPSVGGCGGNLYDEEGNATTSFSRKYRLFYGNY